MQMSKLPVIALIVLFLFSSNTAFAKDKKEERNFRWRANRGYYGYSESDVRAEIKFGRNLAARILTKYPLWKNEKTTIYINKIGTALATQVGRSDLKFYFAILDTPEVNAFAIPGGYIFLTRGALEIMENEAQLVGTLSHEIAHINQRHIVKLLKIKGTDNSFLSSVGVAAGGGVVAGIMVLEQLIEQAFDYYFGNGLEHQMEWQADSECLQVMIATGYDWKSYRNLLTKIYHFSEQAKGKSISHTHPSLQERIDHIEQEITNNNLTNFVGQQKTKRFHENIRL